MKKKTGTDRETYCGVTVGREMNVIRLGLGPGIISIQKTCLVTLAIIFISNVFFGMTCRRSCASVSVFVFDHMPSAGRKSIEGGKRRNTSIEIQINISCTALTPLFGLTKGLITSPKLHVEFRL